MTSFWIASRSAASWDDDVGDDIVTDNVGDDEGGDEGGDGGGFTAGGVAGSVVDGFEPRDCICSSSWAYESLGALLGLRELGALTGGATVGTGVAGE